MIKPKWKVPKPPIKIRKEIRDKKEVSKLKKLGWVLKHEKGDRFILEKKLSKWEIFQERIKILLEVLGFQDVVYGQESWLGRYQIDVVGGYEGTFLVFECKSSGQPKVKKLTQEINIFAGKKREIEEAIKEKFGRKYNEVKYILALEDIEVSENDKKTAKDNDIFIWGSAYLKTVEDLFSIIGPLTIHYILKELGVSPKLIRDEEGGTYYRVPAFRITVGEEQMYSFFMSAEKLLNLAYVFRLQPGNEEAYQRLISKKRIFGTRDEMGITEFINNGGFFKNTIVCSFDTQVKFEPKPMGVLLQESNLEFGILNIPKLYGTVWIIDGQHRLYGFAGADPEKRKINIGVIAYQDVDKKKQARDFIDINQKQKSVDPNTLWDLLSQVDPNSIQGAITKIAKGLNKQGIFEGKILIPGEAYLKRAAYPLKLANICNSLYDLKLLDYRVRDNLYKPTPEVTDNNRYPDSIIKYPIMVLDQYFSLLWDIAEETIEWRKGFILHNNGFNVFLRVLVEILKYLRGEWNKQRVKDLIEEPLRQYFKEKFERLKEIRALTSNEAGRARVALEIIQHINLKEESFAREFIEEAKKREKLMLEKSEPYQKLKELETSLRLFIEEKLKETGKNWWKQRVPIDVQEKAKINLQRNQSPWPWVTEENRSPIFYIDFPDYAKIMQRKDNWREIFSKVFKDPNFIFPKLKELENIRNKIAHIRPLTSEECTTLNLYTNQIIKAIESFKKKRQ